MPTRRSDELAALRLSLQQPAISHPQPLLGEGDHTRPDGTQFAVEWHRQKYAGDNVAGWYWYNFQFDETTDTYSSSHGPFNHANAAYEAALQGDA